MISIPCNNRIKLEAPLKCDIHLVFKVDEKKCVQQIISSLTKKVLGLHLKLSHDSSTLHYINENPPIYKMQNFKDLEKASINYSKKHKNDPYTRFGSIGYNDNMVLLSVSHSFGDGGYLKYIADNILDDSNIYIPSHFPYEMQDIFKERFEKAPNNIPFWANNDKVIRIETNDQSKLHPATDVCYSTVKIPSKNLQCYDSKTKKLHSFTDSLWTSYLISSIAHNKNRNSLEIPKCFSIPTCVDFRRYLPNQNYSTCSMFSAVFPEAPISPKMSLQEIGKAMKIDLKKRMEKGEDFGILKSSGSIENLKKKVFLQLSYMGSIHIERPITDVFVGLSMDAVQAESMLLLMGFSSIMKPSLPNEEERNDVFLRLRYSPTTLYKDEVDQMMKNIEYVLTKIPIETSIEEAVKAVSSFNYN